MRLRNFHFALPLVWLATACPVWGAGPTISSCVVTLLEDVPLSVREAGMLMKLAVEEGDAVTQGQVLGQVDVDKVELQRQAAELERDAARLESENDANVKAAQATVGVAQSEYQGSVHINRTVPDAVSKFELERLRLTFERAELQRDVADMEKEVAGLTFRIKQQQVKAAENEMERRTLVSPLDGVVEKRYASVGQWINPGEPVYQILRMDVLRVEGYVDAAQHDPRQLLDRPVKITVEVAEGDQTRTLEFPGTLRYTSPRVEADGDYRVWAEVQNRQYPPTASGKVQWILRAGQRVTMEVL